MFSHFADAADAAVEAIAKRTVDLNVRHVLIVPDKYTLYFEKRLFGENGGAFDVEVLTFNRLFGKAVGTSDAYLSKQGAVMILKSILETVDLSCFGRSVHYKGFAEKMYGTIAQLLAAGTDPLSMRCDGALGAKLDDIAEVYRRYAAATNGKFCDASGRLELLIRGADTPYIRDAYFYIVNFNGMTGQAQRVVDALASVSRGVTVFETEPVRGKIEAAVYTADDEIGRLKSAARQIRLLGYRGVRYGDMNVVYTGDLRQLKRIFGEYEIPYFADATETLGDHPLSRFMLGAVECVRRGYRRKDMILLAKNMYAGVDKRDADAFENYCNARLIDYLGFFRPFDDEAAERVRARLDATLTPFAARIKNADAERFADACERLIVAARENADPKADEAAFGAAAAEKTAGVLRTAASLLGGCSLSTVVDAVKEGLSSTELRALPNYRDTVTVGNPAVFRGARCKALFIVSASEGEVPVYTADEGLITDAEVDTLANFGICADPKTGQTNARAADDLREILLSAGSVYLYTTAGKRLSSVIHGVLGKRVETSDAYERAAMAFADPQQGHADPKRLVADRCVCYAAAAELFITEVGNIPYVASIAAALPELETYIDRAPAIAPVIDAPRYMDRKQLGVSEIESYFRCPRGHFFAYGLKCKPRDTGELNALDVGTFLHAVVDRFVGLDDDRPIETTVNEIVDELGAKEKKFTLDCNAALWARIRAEAIAVCGVVRHQLLQGDFRPLYREATFSSAEGANLPPIVLHTEDGDVELVGKIDRVDVSDDYVRVVDYKTGSQKFAFTDVYYGLKLQLPVYLAAATAATGKQPAGMFYFPFKTRWDGDETTNRLSGPYNADEDCLVRLDRGLSAEGKFDSTVFSAKGERKNGVLKLSSRAAGTDAAGLRRLCARAERTATAAVEEMRRGHIAASPMRIGRKDPCAFCDFRPCCDRPRGRKGAAIEVAAKKNLTEEDEHAE